jgi:predicted metal-dependent hydrolase
MPTIAIDQIIRSRRKTVALIVTSDGKLVVRAPFLFPRSEIIKLINRKKGWIEKRLVWVRKNRVETGHYKFVQGSQFWFLGKRFSLSISDNISPNLFLDKEFHLSRKALSSAEQLFARWYREQARNILTDRTRLLAKQSGFIYRKVMITSARTRWGSCSSSGTISFPWRLVMAPMPVIDYVIIHELAHTVERNHQKRFWELVAAIKPDYKIYIRWLKENGSSLRIGG